jgi:hypothetical protein
LAACSDAWASLMLTVGSGSPSSLMVPVPWEGVPNVAFEETEDNTTWKLSELASLLVMSSTI